MATEAENQNENRYTFSSNQPLQHNLLTSTACSLELTDNELVEIQKKATWMRRTCQPFHEFEAIISVGLDSQTATQHLIEPETREYITDLQAP